MFVRLMRLFHQANETRVVSKVDDIGNRRSTGRGLDLDVLGTPQRASERNTVREVQDEQEE